MGYNEYEITLPNGEKVYVYFIGPQLKKVLDAYKVNYKIKKKVKVSNNERKRLCKNKK